MFHVGGTCDHIMRSLTLRKLIVVVAALVLVKLVWHVFHGATSDVVDLKDVERMPDFGLDPAKCIFINGECKQNGDEDEMPDIMGKGLHAYRDKFYLDGQPFRIIGGSFHYFRTQPEQWMDRLLKMKAAGLNTVTTYIPWNVHERVRLQYNFQGRYNLASFIRMVQSTGLHMIIRAGPYICAEWDLGGLPAWLLHHRDIKLRSSSSKQYLTYVEQYFSKLLPILTPFTHKKGGPVIAFQIENEFGSWMHRDDKYLKFLLEQHKSYGLDELFLTSDGKGGLEYGTLPGVLATINFAKNPGSQLSALREFRPNQPLMVTEFWSGWFDHWYEKHHAFNSKETADRVSTILGPEFNASINFYMFTGGTNFAFYNGANNDSVYKPTVTSYDYDAPISESGDVTKKFHAIRDVIKGLGLGPPEWSEMPANAQKKSYGEISLTQILGLNEIVKISNRLYGTLSYEQPRCMEMLDYNDGFGQSYGWILYRARFQIGKTIKIVGTIEDRAQVFVNKKLVGVHSWTKAMHLLAIDAAHLNGSSNQLEIVVENHGRVNYRRANDDGRLLENQIKGIQGRIYVDDVELKNWEHIPLDFEYDFREALSGSNSWQKYDAGIKRSLPVALKGELIISDSEPMDTFLDMRPWNKGIVLVNGFNVGRYWSEGPQLSLYIPGPLLHKGLNEFIVFELENPTSSLLFSAEPRLG